MTIQCVKITAATILGLSLLVGCTSVPTQPASTNQPNAAATSQAEHKEPILYTGKKCFSSMAGQAQRWQVDALPFHMESDFNAEATGQEGKVTTWRASFASPSRGTMRTFICSGSRLPSAPPVGVSSSADIAYAPNVPSLMFDPSYFQTDSDKAFTLTVEHGGADLFKKDPQQPVTYLLKWEPAQKALFWYVIYGKSMHERKGLGVINATTGAFVRAGK